eukprot:362401-Chlamydomonas_euryale.AAC.9
MRPPPPHALAARLYRSPCHPRWLRRPRPPPPPRRPLAPAAAAAARRPPLTPTLTRPLASRCRRPTAAATSPPRGSPGQRLHAAPRRGLPRPAGARSRRRRRAGAPAAAAAG